MFQEIPNANIEIHAHPLNGNNTIVDVVAAMDNAGLDVVVLSSLYKEMLPDASKEIEKHYDNIIVDEAGIRLPNGKYLLSGREHSTKEGFHVLTVGCALNDIGHDAEIREIIDKGLEKKALVVIAHPFIGKENIRNLGRIPPSFEQELEDLCKEYPWQIGLEWNAYFIPWMQGFASQVWEFFGQKVHYYDINREAEKLSEHLARQGYFVPVLATTDLHANNERQLQAIGTARFKTHVRGETASDIVASMKENIFSGMYQNQKAYVSTAHFLEAMCRPSSILEYIAKI